jgi:opacity protein-like surface antigen
MKKAFLVILFSLIFIAITANHAQAEETINPKQDHIKETFDYFGSYYVEGAGSGIGFKYDLQYSVLGVSLSYTKQIGVSAGNLWNASIYGCGIYATLPGNMFIILPNWIWPYAGIGLTGINVTGTTNNLNFTSGVNYMAGVKVANGKNLALDIAYNGLAQGTTIGIDFIF